MNIADRLLKRASEAPNRPAIVEQFGRRQRISTFRELLDDSHCIAGKLFESGLRPGHSVFVLVPMSKELYAVLAAVFQLGLVAIFVDPSAGLANLAKCCQMQPPDALVATTIGHALRMITPVIARIPRKFTFAAYLPGAISLRRRAGVSPYDHIEQNDPSAPALITFTSGSTAEPKAVVRTHGFLLAQHLALNKILHLRTGDVDLTTMPIVLMANLASGVTSVIAQGDLRYPGKLNPKQIIEQVEKQAISSLTTSPALLGKLTEYCRDQGIVLERVSKVITGGGPIFPRVLDCARAVMPNANVTAIYGSTEAEPIASLTTDRISSSDRRAMAAGAGLLAGEPVPDLEVKVIQDSSGHALGPLSKDSWQHLMMPAGAPGEIVVRGPHVIKTYLHGRGDTESKVQVGDHIWHRTGDAGYFDERGRLWLLGRCAAKVADARGVVYPLMAEAIAIEDQRVRNSALVGVGGKRILAVQLTNSTRHRDRVFGDIQTEMMDRLAGLHIDHVRIVNNIPLDRRHNSKIDYPALFRNLRR